MFQQKVYTWRGRCFPCHFDGVDSPLDAPQWITTGTCEVGALESMRTVIDSGYVDLDDPSHSLLLLKPLDESLGGMQHGGDTRIHSKDEGTYVDFLAWLTRYAACQK